MGFWRHESTCFHTSHDKCVMTDKTAPDRLPPGPDETDTLGIYTPTREPTKEEELYAVILALAQQGCGTVGRNKLDSWAISAYELALEALEAAGFVEIEPGGRITATLLPKAQEFEAWIELHNRRKRVIEAARQLVTRPESTPEQVARLYDITVAEIMDERRAQGEALDELARHGQEMGLYGES